MIDLVRNLPEAWEITEGARVQSDGKAVIRRVIFVFALKNGIKIV